MRKLLPLCLLAASIAATAQTALAPTPPLGWNSWDSYGFTITEAQLKANVAWFHEHLQPLGWQYIVIDEGWNLAHPESTTDPGFNISPDGRILPVANRFPSIGASQSFKAIGDYIHGQGLKFGIHIIHGIPRVAVDKNMPIAGSSFHATDAANRSDICRWNKDNYGVSDNAAGQAYYDSILQLYAGWGVDFLKVDCISSPYNISEIHMLSRAIEKTGRPIILSLSPGPTPLSEASDVQQHAQLWRISDDFWDVWSDPHNKNSFPQTLKNQFTLLSQWSQFAGPDHWPDADMLPIGYLGPHPGWGDPRQSRFTHEEARTLITLWSVARSPLILGANLTRMDTATGSLLTNPEVLDVDQHSTGNHPIETPGTQAKSHAGNIVIWTANLGPDHILAVFNRGDGPAVVKTPDWQKLGNQFGLDQPSYRVRDLWQRKDLGPQSSLSVSLPPHGAALLRLSH